MIADWSLLGSKAAASLPSFGVSIVVLVAVLFFTPKIHVLLSVICLLSMCYSAYKNYRRKYLPSVWVILKQQFSVIGFTLLVLYIDTFLGGWGVLGVIASGVVVALIILYKRRQQYVEALKSIERMIWGKSLDELRREKP